jgi:hypothetical protein
VHSVCTGTVREAYPEHFYVGRYTAQLLSHHLLYDMVRSYCTVLYICRRVEQPHTTGTSNVVETEMEISRPPHPGTHGARKEDDPIQYLIDVMHTRETAGEGVAVTGGTGTRHRGPEEGKGEEKSRLQATSRSRMRSCLWGFKPWDILRCTLWAFAMYTTFPSRASRVLYMLY